MVQGERRGADASPGAGVHCFLFLASVAAVAGSTWKGSVRRASRNCLQKAQKRRRLAVLYQDIRPVFALRDLEAPFFFGRKPHKSCADRDKGSGKIEERRLGQSPREATLGQGNRTRVRFSGAYLVLALAQGNRTRVRF